MNARVPIVSADLSPGPLFEHFSEEGDLYHFYCIATVVTLEDGREFIHEFQPFGRSAQDAADRFLARVKAAGSVDLNCGWYEVAPQPSLEERLGPFGIEWQLEQNERSLYA